MKQNTDVTPGSLDDISRRFVMYALCILFPLLGIVYGWHLKGLDVPDTAQDGRQALGRDLIRAGVAGMVWWVSSCGILWLALMAVLKIINLVP